MFQFRIIDWRRGVGKKRVPEQSTIEPESRLSTQFKTQLGITQNEPRVDWVVASEEEKIEISRSTFNPDLMAWLIPSPFDLAIHKSKEVCLSVKPKSV